jgi:nicotinate-nucleotide adenylyltransferase
VAGLSPAVDQAQALRLGVLGGTFDPVHHGHLAAAAEARHQLGLDRVLFVPAGVPPHKPDRPITPAADRLRMLEMAIAGRPHFEISRVDLDRPGPCYTVDTLTLLRGAWDPAPTLFFIEGADSLAELPTWYQPRRILELCHLAVVDRPGIEVDLPRLEAQLPGLTANLHWLRMPLLEISSSDLRARVRAGRPIAYLLPADVENYIYQQGLYRDKAPAIPHPRASVSAGLPGSGRS